MPNASAPAYPSLYQINTRVTLNGLSRRLGRPATLDDFPDSVITLTDIGSELRTYAESQEGSTVMLERRKEHRG